MSALEPQTRSTRHACKIKVTLSFVNATQIAGATREMGK